MTQADLMTSGVVLLTVVAIASGGAFMLRVIGGHVRVNELQRTYFRAGHAHAGVLVTLGLVVRLLLAQGTCRSGAHAWRTACSTPPSSSPPASS